MDLSFLWIIFAMADYGVMHSLLASKMIKKSVEGHYPGFYARFYRITYNFVAVVALIPVGWLMQTLPDRQLYTIPYPFIIVTLIIQGVAGLAAVFALQGTGTGAFLGFDQLFGVPDRPGQLKTDGLYRYVRHPIYSCGLIIIWLLPWMTVNRLALIASVTAYLLIGVLFEERKILSDFGEEYARYRSQTPMLIPDFRKLLRS